MQRHEFELNAHDLDAAGKELRFPVRADWMRGILEDSEATPVGEDGGWFEFRASKTGNDVLVHGHLEASLEVPCARCLGPARVAVDSPVTALFVPRATYDRSRDGKDEDEEVEFASEEADLQPFDGDLVVLDDLVRDELLLGIPMIPLCSEDCPGMAEAPKAAPEPPEPAIDPRLAPLLRLKQRT